MTLDTQMTLDLLQELLMALGALTLRVGRKGARVAIIYSLGYPEDIRPRTRVF